MTLPVMNAPASVVHFDEPSGPVIREANVLRRSRLRKLKGLFPGVPMAANKVPFGEDPLDRRHRAGGVAEPCPECGAGPGNGLQFSLGTMLLVTTFVAICLAISSAVPLLGIPLSVIAVGGLVRTMIVGWARIRAGRRFDLADKLDEFEVSSFVFVIALVVGLGATMAVAGGAFLLAGLLLPLAEALFPIVLFAAVPAAVVAGIFVFAKLYLSFDTTLRQPIAATPEQHRLNQLSDTGYRHRPG
jgi:hypothetical protein